MKLKIKKMSTMGIILVFFISSVILADDDDDGDEEEHSHHAKWSYNEGARNLDSVPANATYKKECSACHMAYHPGMLPERSWKKMMNQLSTHFGEEASLDAKTKAEIEKFLTEHSSDKTTAQRSQRIAATIPSNESPLRISETLYFKRKHDELSASIFKRSKIGSASNCLACHPGAEKGYFSEHEIKIPKF